MKQYLRNTAKTQKYLNSLPSIYLVACWARYGVMDFYFTGKYNEDGIPLVYKYDDFNGTQDLFVLMPITSTTTGSIAIWTTHKGCAEFVAKQLNELNEFRYNRKAN